MAQGLGRTRMQGHLARLGELRASDRQHPSTQIHVADVQRQGLGQAQTATRDQAEQRLVDQATQAGTGAKLARSGQQLPHLFRAVDVRGLALGQPPEDRVVWHLGGGLELLHPACEGAQVLQPPSPGPRIDAAVGVQTCPLGHDLQGQGSAVTRTPDVLGQAAQAVGGSAQLEAQDATFREEALHERGQTDRHDALPVAAAAMPGQGRATSTRRPLSSLA